MRAGFPELFLRTPTIVSTTDRGECVARELLFLGRVTVEMLSEPLKNGCPV